jgi:iron complex outermembrane recepter protein
MTMIQSKLDSVAGALQRGVAAFLVIGLGGLGLAFGIFASPAHAQGASDGGSDDPWAGVEEMLVTGEATAGLLGDETISVVAFDAEELVDIGAQDVSDLARFTPSLEINSTSATTPTFFIRGVGLNDANSNAAGAIAIYIDDVPINAPAIQLASLFDTGAVEVLRGPQAYIDARNASGGMINTVSKKPDGEFSAFLRSEYGRFGFRDFEGAIGVPVYKDIVSARFAFRRTYRSDLIDNRCGDIPYDDPDTGNPPRSCNETNNSGGAIPSGLPSQVNDVNRWGTRAQLKITPPDAPAEMEWLLNFHSARIDQTSPLGQIIGTSIGRPTTGTGYIEPFLNTLFRSNLRTAIREFPNLPNNQVSSIARFRTLDQVTRDIEDLDPFENDYDFIGDEVLTQLGGFVRGDMMFGDVEFKTVTGIERYDRERDSDFDFTSNPAIHTLREDDATQYTQNFSLRRELESLPVILKGGSYLLIENLDTQSDFALQGGGPGSRRRLNQAYTQDLYSFGVFGSFAWQPLEDLTLESGIRVNWERKDFEIGIDRIRANGDIDTAEPSETTRTWSAPTYGFTLTYDLTEDVYANWKYTRGWKAGHINASVLEVQGTDRVTSEPSVAKPETIDAVEFGLGGTFIDGRIETSVSAFYYKYTDYQVFLIQSQVGSPPQLEIINANDAQIYGVEADLKLEPLRDIDAIPEELSGLTLKANFAWLESEFLDFSDTRTLFLGGEIGEVNIGSFTADFTGNRLPNTPQFKLSASAEWAFRLGKAGVLTPRYDITWTDDTFFDPSEGVGVSQFAAGQLPKYAIGQRAYALHDIRLTYVEPTGMITLSGWVRNVTDKIYKRNVLDVGTGFNQINVFVGDPRTYGGSLTVKF